MRLRTKPHVVCRANAVGFLLAAMIAAGCSGEDPPDDPALEATHSFGLMSVGYTHDWQGGQVGTTAAGLELITTAQFVRYTALNRGQVSRLLALPLDPDADLPGSDRCKLYDLTIDLGEDREFDRGKETANVDLLEAGDLRVETSSGTVKLEPRHFPGLLPFISGVVYGEAQTDRASHTGAVRVSASGGEAVGAFRVDAASPSLPRISHAALGSDQDLVLRWTKSAAADRDDVFYLEARYPTSKRDLVLRCAAKDDGDFIVPSADLARLSGGMHSTGKNARVVVELTRVRRTFFAARGLDTGELRISIKDRTSLQVTLARSLALP